MAKLCGKRHYISNKKAKYILVGTLTIASIFLNSARRSVDMTLVILTMGSTKSAINQSMLEYTPKYKLHVKGGVTFKPDEINHIKLSAYISYCIVHPICGVLSDLYGAKYFITSGLLAISFLCILFPLVIMHLPWWATPILLVGIGAAECMVVTPQWSVLAYFLSKSEITFLSSAINCASFLGTIGTLQILISSNFIIDWFVVQFFLGLGGIIVFTIVMRNLYSAPWKHPYLKVEPKKRYGGAEKATDEDRFPKSIHWKSILTDEAVWSIWMGTIGHKWMFYLLMFNVAFYFCDILQFSLSATIWLVQIPNIVALVGIFLTGYLSNWLVNGDEVPVVYIRILPTIGGSILCCTMTICGTYASNGYVGLFFITLCMFCMGTGYSGSYVNVFDLTKHYSATVMGIANAITFIITFCSHLTMGKLKNGDIRNTWRKQLWLSMFICLISTLLTFVWIRAEKRNWDVIVVDDDDDNEEN